MVGREGRRLAEFGLPSSWGPLRIEIDGPFDSDYWASGVGPAKLRSEQLGLALLGALDAMPELFAGLEDALHADEFGRTLVLRYLLDARGQWSARRLRELVALSPETTEAAIQWWAKAESGGWGLPAAWVDDDASAGRPWPEHPLTAVACLREGSTNWVSLADARAHIHARGQLEVVEVDEDSLPEHVWRLAPLERSVLVDIFGPAIVPFARAAWARRNPGSHELPAIDADLREVFTTPTGARGFLVLPTPGARRPEGWPPTLRRGATMRVFTCGHALAPVTLALPLGPFHGAIDIPEARVTRHGDHLIKDEQWPALALEHAALALARAFFESCQAAAELDADTRARVEAWTLDLDELRSRAPQHLDPGWLALALDWHRWHAPQPEHDHEHPL